MATAISLEAKALDRKERLRALKRKKDGETMDSTKNNNTDHISLPKPKFRSYKPEDESLKANVVGDAQPGDIRAEVKDQLESASSSVVIDELDITNLAPRKPDWDLKRDVAKKLNKLERRTQRAIAELIRDRLKQRQEDLANIVTSGAAPEKR